MNIAVLGGGHGAHTMAADLAIKGNDVNLYEMPKFEESVSSLLETKEILMRSGEEGEVATLQKVTTDIDEAILGVEWIFIVVPAFAHRPYANLLAHRTTDGQRIILFPGTFGSLEFLKIMGDKGVKERVTVAETDTLPWACRLVGGGEVKVYHTLKQIGIGVYPSRMTEEILDPLRRLYPLVPHPNVLACGLNSLNPVLHVASVLLNAGRIEYSRGDFYLYEEGITPSVAKVVEAVDEERRNIAEAFGFTLPSVAEDLYQTGYGPKGSLWQAVKGSYLTPVKGPTHLHNRYLTEDTPYGLLTWSQLGDVVGVETSTIDSLVTLVSKLTENNYWVEGRTLERLGIARLSKDEILKKVSGDMG